MQFPLILIHSISAAVHRGQTKEAQILGAIVCLAGRVWRGRCRGRRLVCALGCGAVFRPVEPTKTLMQFIQFGWQGDPHLLVEGQSFKPVLQLLARWTEGGGGGGGKSGEGTQRGLEVKTRLTRLRENMKWQSGSKSVLVCRQVEMASESPPRLLLQRSNKWLDTVSQGEGGHISHVAI